MATNARDFNGTSDSITTNLGSLVAFATSTIVAMVKLDNVTANRTIFSSGASGSWLLYTESSLLKFWNGSNAVQIGSGTLSTGVWYILGFTKTTGTTTGVFHTYNYNTTTWAHTNANATLANSGSPATSNAFGGTNAIDGVIQAASFFTSSLSNGNLESMVSTRQSWLDLSPAAMWTFNQASTGTALEDEIGAADQSAISGTTVVTGNPDWADTTPAAWPPEGAANSPRTLLRAQGGARLR